MKNTKILILTSLITLSACAAMEWQKPNMTEQQRQQDMNECRYDASKATASIINGFDAGFQKGTLYRQCMEIRGYKPMRVEK